jgi:nicotinate dehydrogenase subunit B
MREGIHRDGRHLYPAFPYPSFAQTRDADLQALYAFLMAQPAVRQRNAESRLTFPFNLRPLMAGWNLLFNRQRDAAPDPAQSAEWNRGRYLVDGLGHCGACHTPRNWLGAERSAAYLAGGEAEGWQAPALTGSSLGPIPWSEAEFYRYLKTGASPHHGAASGPMAPVAAELRELPDADIRAMAAYLGSFNTPLPAAQTDAVVAEIERRTSRAANPAISAAARLYEGGCAACHETGRAAPLLNAGPSLGLSSKVQAATPANFVNLLIEGGQHGIGSMPSFAAALDDRQIADLARYVRARFAPDRPAWGDVETAIARARSR